MTQLLSILILTPFTQAVVLEVNPLYLTLSTAIATSFAFMLPVATPPNAIVFAYGHMKIIDMVNVPFIDQFTFMIDLYSEVYIEYLILYYCINASPNNKSKYEKAL